MTLRAGTFDSSTPDYRGVIRDDGWPVYTCYHFQKHNIEEARECARQALAHLRKEKTLPNGWSLSERQIEANEFEDRERRKKEGGTSP